MGVQCRPFGTPSKYTHSARTSKAETNPKYTSVSSQQSMKPGRSPARTAVQPLVQRAPWPSWFSPLSGRKGKSNSPSTSEKVTSTPPTTKDVGVQAEPPQTPSLRCSSSCSTLLPAQSPDPVGECILESNKQPFSFLGKSDVDFIRAFVLLFVLCFQESRTGKWREFPKEVPILVRAITLGFRAPGLSPLITRSCQTGYKMHYLCRGAGPSDGAPKFHRGSLCG
ncbi:hypothetical protein EI94DRAFT_748723 [Lactarius quietus]|nr:hypothetical protein EI94DRAFT_748723 [Lactarius quietus]